MNIIRIIEKKVNKKTLSPEEIRFTVNGYVSKVIPDYQMSALLTAIMINGLNHDETKHLTLAYLNSGKKIDLSKLRKPTVDKHSTGGVGDKTTLIIGPILACAGAIMAKMSGRSLGFTGGTIDKLESIKNFSTSFSVKRFVNQLEKCGLSVMSHSPLITPADARIYALRDVTGTIGSQGLITASVMAKKLAVGAKLIFLDVKCGSGAFMQTKKEAVDLAQQMVKIGNHFKHKTIAYVTNMNAPLGRAVGNKIEVLEAIEVMKGNGPKDLTKLVMKMVCKCLVLVKIFSTEVEALKKVKSDIKSGATLEKFYEMVKEQGGDTNFLKSPTFWKPKHKAVVKAPSTGIVHIVSAKTIGLVAQMLGAGRTKKMEKIDPDAGVFCIKKNNEKVTKGSTVLALYSSSPISNEILVLAKKAFCVQSKRKTSAIILKEIY